MLVSPNQQAKDSKQQPLLPLKRQKDACLKAYILLYEEYQLYFSVAFRYLLSYFLAHIIVAICFEVARSGSQLGLSLMVLPEVLWAAVVLCFRGSFESIDPHVFGIKRINVYKIKIRTTHLYFIVLFLLFLIVLARDYLLYSSYLFPLIDITLILLTSRVILVVFNYQNQAEQEIMTMKEQQFYFVPVINRKQMQEPFHMDQEGDLNEAARLRRQQCLKDFEKYFKPLKKKELKEYHQDEFQSQLYSH